MVPHFIETNVFGMYDPNPMIDRSLFMSKWLMDNAMKRLAPISRGIIPSRFDFVNNPVESPTTPLCAHILIDWKQENKDCIVLGRCGRPDNGIYNAVSVNAAAELRLQGYDVRFLVVAPPSNMVQDLKDKSIPYATIDPTVDPDTLSAFYNALDIYAHARADGETFGVNIAEAMIHGKPVVTHVATPSHPGMGVFQAQTQLVDNEITGFVVENDVAEYAAALKKLIDDRTLRATMGEVGRSKAQAEYHVDTCVQKLESIYMEVM